MFAVLPSAQALDGWRCGQTGAEVHAHRHAGIPRQADLLQMRFGRRKRRVTPGQKGPAFACAKAGPFRSLTKVFASFACKLSIALLQTQGISRLRARPGGFPIAPWTPSVPILVKLLQVRGSKIHFRSVPMKDTAFFQQSKGPRFRLRETGPLAFRRKRLMPAPDAGFPFPPFPCWRSSWGRSVRPGRCGAFPGPRRCLPLPGHSGRETTGCQFVRA